MLGRNRHLVADLEARRLVVEHHQLRRGDDLDVGDIGQQVEHHARVTRAEQVRKTREKRIYRHARRSAEGKLIVPRLEEPLKPVLQRIVERHLCDGGLVWLRVAGCDPLVYMKASFTGRLFSVRDKGGCLKSAVAPSKSEVY